LITQHLTHDLKYAEHCHTKFISMSAILADALILSFFDRLIAPMRSIKPPVCFIEPVHKVFRRKILLKPFQGQPRKYKVERRLPALEVRESTIRRAGMGVFLDQDVKEGDTITVYRQKVISESRAKQLKKKVSV